MASPWPRGYVQVYTGPGKGKTTAALGLALRAAGHGLRTYIGQFMKGRLGGEHRAIERLAGLITIECYGSGKFLNPTQPPDPSEAARARDGLARARDAMLSGQYRIIVLDEATVAAEFGLLAAADLLAFIRDKPPEVELIITGRSAPPVVVAAADLVSDIHAAKHYFERGAPAREGIEE